jgi:hypothetical protein
MKQTKKQEVVATEPTSTAIAVADDTGSILGDWTKKDIQVPTMKLIQPMSVTDEDHPNGCYLHDGAIEVCRGEGKRADVYPLILSKRYELMIPFESDEPQQFFNSEADAMAAGYSIGTGNGEVAPFAEVVFLVPVPEEFGQFEFNGQGYAKTKYTYRKWHFDKGAKVWSVSMNTRKPMWHTTWEIDSQARKNAKGKHWAPLLFNKGATDPKLIEWLEAEVI